MSTTQIRAKELEQLSERLLPMSFRAEVSTVEIQFSHRCLIKPSRLPPDWLPATKGAVAAGTRNAGAPNTGRIRDPSQRALVKICWPSPEVNENQSYNMWLVNPPTFHVCWERKRELDIQEMYLLA